MIPVPSLENSINLKRKPTRDQLKHLTRSFNAWVVYYLLETIYQEFLVKSNRGTDSLGEKWAELSDSRRIYRALIRGEKTKYGIGRKKGTKKELLANRYPPINIDTKRLINSLKPGKVSGGEYIVSGPDQKVTINLSSINVKTVVPYASDVQEVRPFIPLDLTPWLRQAVAKAKSPMMQELRKYDLV